MLNLLILNIIIGKKSINKVSLIFIALAILK